MIEVGVRQGNEELCGRWDGLSVQNAFTLVTCEEHVYYIYISRVLVIQTQHQTMVCVCFGKGRLNIHHGKIDCCTLCMLKPCFDFCFRRSDVT